MGNLTFDSFLLQYLLTLPQMFVRKVCHMQLKSGAQGGPLPMTVDASLFPTNKRQCKNVYDFKLTLGMLKQSLESC